MEKWLDTVVRLKSGETGRICGKLSSGEYLLEYEEGKVIPFDLSDVEKFIERKEELQ